MYIELDHNLVPGKISKINESQNLSTGKEPQKSSDFETTTMNEKRYQIHHGDFVEAIKSHNSQRIAENQEYIAELKQMEEWHLKHNPQSLEKSKSKIAEAQHTETKILTEFEIWKK